MLVSHPSPSSCKRRRVTAGFLATDKQKAQLAESSEDILMMAMNISRERELDEKRRRFMMMMIPATRSRSFFTC